MSLSVEESIRKKKNTYVRDQRPVSSEGRELFRITASCLFLLSAPCTDVSDGTNVLVPEVPPVSLGNLLLTRSVSRYGVS